MSSKFDFLQNIFQRISTKFFILGNYYVKVVLWKQTISQRLVDLSRSSFQKIFTERIWKHSKKRSLQNKELIALMCWFWFRATHPIRKRQRNNFILYSSHKSAPVEYESHLMSLGKSCLYFIIFCCFSNKPYLVR